MALLGTCMLKLNLQKDVTQFQNLPVLSVSYLAGCTISFRKNVFIYRGHLTGVGLG